MSNESENQDLENLTAPQNDVERWIIATYAMWSEYYSEGDWQYIAGSSVKAENASNMQVMLSRDWGINTKDELLDMVMYLTALYEDEEDVDPEDIATGGWDLCRACQILGMAFIAGMINRDEMLAVSLMVCSLIQYYYPSWLHLYSSYLNGYQEWRLGDEDDEDEDDDGAFVDEDDDEDFDDENEDDDDDFDDENEDDDDDFDDDDEDEDEYDEALEDVEAREEICRRLLTMPNGPCSVPWDLELPFEFDEEDEE